MRACIVSLRQTTPNRPNQYEGTNGVIPASVAFRLKKRNNALDFLLDLVSSLLL